MKRVPESLGLLLAPGQRPEETLRTLVTHLDALLRQIGYRVNRVLPADGSEPVDPYVEFREVADPAAPAANRARLFARDNGAGKTQLCVRFPTGAVQVLATEP